MDRYDGKPSADGFSQNDSFRPDLTRGKAKLYLKKEDFYLFEKKNKKMHKKGKHCYYKVK